MLNTDLKGNVYKLLWNKSCLNGGFFFFFYGVFMHHTSQYNFLLVSKGNADLNSSCLAYNIEGHILINNLIFGNLRRNTGLLHFSWLYVFEIVYISWEIYKYNF